MKLVDSYVPDWHSHCTLVTTHFATVLVPLLSMSPHLHIVARYWPSPQLKLVESGGGRPTEGAVRNGVPSTQVRKFWRETIGYVRAQLCSSGIISRDGLTFPDFLGIGAQKAGTTWLHSNLRCHPQVYMPGTKELHYFDRRPHRSLKTYASKFAGAGMRVKGEITPYSAALPKWTIRYIYELMPDAKLILFLRNPIDRAWSQALMNLVVRQKRTFEEVRDEEFVEHFRHPRTVTRGDYLGIVDSWTSVFPEERLFIGFFEQVRDSPRELLTAVFDHIGVSTDVDWASFPLHTVVHRGVRAPLPPQFRAILEEAYADEIDRIADRCGGWAETWRVK